MSCNECSKLLRIFGSKKLFSPMVVERAMTLRQSGTSAVSIALAPFYSMGLFHATKKRRIVSWSVSLSVAMLVGMLVGILVGFVGCCVGCPVGVPEGCEVGTPVVR